MNSATAPRSYRQTRRAEATHQTRLALMAAAAQVFWEEEWESATLEHLAALAGTTKQTLLRHFGSRNGLFEATWEHYRDEVAHQRDAAPVGDIPGAVDNLLDHYEATGRRVLRLLRREGRSATVDAVLEAGRAYHHAWVDHVFAPWLRPLTPAARLRRRAMLIAACDVQAWKVLDQDLGLSPRQARTALIEAIERLVREDP